CVTSVPITHATPAGFCINISSRNAQSDIALQYLDLNFDVFLGGGTEYFSGDLRKDKVDLFGKFAQKGYDVAHNKADLLRSNGSSKPLLGVFHQAGLPYTLDINSNPELKKSIPTLKEMTIQAINRLKNNKKGFV